MALSLQQTPYCMEVANTPEEAEAFLEDCMAMVCDDKAEVIEYLEDEMDIVGMDEEEILEAEEVFAIGDGNNHGNEHSIDCNT